MTAPICAILHRRQPVETRHERVLHGGRNGERGQRSGQDVLFAFLAHQSRAENRLGQLLDEERNAVRLHDDLFQDVVRKRLAMSHALDHRDRLRPGETVEGECRHIAPLHPGCLELRPERDDRQHPLVLQALERSVHQIQCRRINPMGVFQHDQRRIAALNI